MAGSPNTAGAPRKSEKRAKMHFPVAPKTGEIFKLAAEKLGKKSAGWLLDDLAAALEKLLE